MKKLLIIGLASGLVATGAQADIVSAWDVQGHGSPVDTTLSASTVISGLTGTPALSRTGATASAAGNSFASTNWNLTTTFDPATASSYISFSVSPTVGNSLTLTSLDYSMNGSNTAPKFGVWGYTTDNGATWTLQTAFTLTFAISTATWDFSDFTVQSGTTVKFNFWDYGSGAGNAINSGSTPATGGSVRIANISGNDLVLNGSIAAVPESATYGIAIAGVLALVVFARRSLINRKAAKSEA